MDRIEVEKRALVVISFGSTVPEARAYINRAEQHIRSKHMDRMLFSSYTSPFIRKRLEKQGEKILSPEEILNYLSKEGYEDVLLIPTVIVPGLEYDKLLALMPAYQERFAFLNMASPLISTPKDLVTVAEILTRHYQTEEGEGLLLFGHGTDHLANFIYPAMQTAMRCLGKEHAYMATIEGWPTLEDAMSEMRRNGISKVYMIPFLLNAGAHVLKDMIGDQESSWLNLLEAQGFQVRYCDKGLSALDEILDLFGR